MNLKFAAASALTWTVVWLVVGLALLQTISLILPSDIDRGEGVMQLLPAIGVGGLLGGLAFSAIVIAWRSRPSLLDLSVADAAIRGLLTASLLPLVFDKDLGNIAILAPVGALSGVATLATFRIWTQPSRPTSST